MGWVWGDHTCAFLMAPMYHCQALSRQKPRPLNSTRMEVKGQLISSPTFNASGWCLVPPPASASLSLSHPPPPRQPTWEGMVPGPTGFRMPWRPHRIQDALAAPLIFAPSVSSCPVRRGCPPGEIRASEGTARPAAGSAGGLEPEASGATQSVPPRGGEGLALNV